MADEALRELKPRFSRLYAKTGQPSIAPEKLLRALLLQVLYSVRSERMLIEQLDYSLLFRWFVGLNMDDPILGCDGIHEESAASTCRRQRRRFFRSRAPAGTLAGLAVRRALHCGWKSAGGMGRTEEFSPCRLDEEHRVVAQATASRTGARRLDVQLRGDGLQLGAHAQPNPQCPTATGSITALRPRSHQTLNTADSMKMAFKNHRKGSYTLCRTPFFRSLLAVLQAVVDFVAH
jgi:hypothetical protein